MFSLNIGIKRYVLRDYPVTVVQLSRKTFGNTFGQASMAILNYIHERTLSMADIKRETESRA